ncbi:MAG: acyltransferase family protein [Gordonia sp. (in: high G+C Gram-positive bacteria)]
MSRFLASLIALFTRLIGWLTRTQDKHLERRAADDSTTDRIPAAAPADRSDRPAPPADHPPAPRPAAPRRPAPPVPPSSPPMHPSLRGRQMRLAVTQVPGTEPVYALPMPAEDEPTVTVDRETAPVGADADTDVFAITRADDPPPDPADGEDTDVFATQSAADAPIEDAATEDATGADATTGDDQPTEAVADTTTETVAEAPTDPDDEDADTADEDAADSTDDDLPGPGDADQSDTPDAPAPDAPGADVPDSAADPSASEAVTPDAEDTAPAVTDAGSGAATIEIAAETAGDDAETVRIPAAALAGPPQALREAPGRPTRPVPPWGGPPGRPGLADPRSRPPHRPGHPHPRQKPRNGHGPVVVPPMRRIGPAEAPTATTAAPTQPTDAATTTAAETSGSATTEPATTPSLRGRRQQSHTVAPAVADPAPETENGDPPTEVVAAPAAAQVTLDKPALDTPTVTAPATPAETKPETTDAETTTATDAPVPLPAGRIRRALALDGLRGIAVLAVIVYHFFDDAMPGGYLGVDIFFVLSGFLITSLLVREFGGSQTISFAGFWRRRARRILPAAATVLIVCTAVAGLIGGDVAVALIPQFLGSLFFANNWVQIAQSHSYFADTTPQIFMHYWSLAIEEQFYLVWPLVFTGALLLLRRLPLRWRFRLLALVALLLGAGSAAAMALLFTPGVDPSRVYFGSDTHAFGLLTGAMVALLLTTPSTDALDSWPRRVPPIVARILAWTLAPVALVALVGLLFILPDTDEKTYQGGLVVACLLTAITVHTAVRDTGPVAWLLRLPLLRRLGERSFSLYLWHWPVIVFLRDWLDGPKSELPDWVVGALACVVSLVIAELSYRWVETPFRRHGFRGILGTLGAGRITVPAAVLAGSLTVCLFAGAALGASPAKSALEVQLEQQARLLAAAKAQAQHRPTRSRRPADATQPTGSEITAIGDSVMLASSQALITRFPRIYIDAEVSRHYTGGEEVINALAANRTLRKYVVLGFGTNGQAFDGQLDRIMREIGPGHKVILLVPYGPVDGIPQAARQVLDYAPRRANVYLAPWCQAAATHPADLNADGVHPTAPGQQLYVQAVIEGLRQAVTGERNRTIGCPL